MSLLTIDQLFHYEKGSLQSSKCEPGKYNFITAAFEWKTHKSYSHDCEALVFAAAASGSLGRIHYVKGKFTASDLCFILTPKDNSKLPIDLKFYHIIFNLLRNDIVKNTKAGTSKEAIGLTRFGQYKLPYFDIEQQALVNERFGKIEELKTSLSTENFHQFNLISQLRQAFLREAMQGKLIPQDKNDEPASELLKRIKTEKEKLINEGKIKKQNLLPEIKLEEIPYEIPESWVWCRLSEVSINRDESRIPVSREERNRKQKIYDYYGASGIIDKIDGYTHDGNYLLIGEDGANLVARSTPIAFLASGKFWVNNHAHVLATVDETTLNYLCYYLNSINLEQYITGGFQPKLNQGNLDIILIAFPTLPEQQRIVTKLEQLMQLCSGLEKNINQSKEETNLLLQTVLREALEEN